MEAVAQFSGPRKVQATQPAVRVEHLQKGFGGKVVLDGIDLEIRPGEQLSIVGGSGCGKTVLTKHFNGLLKPDSGRVLVYGKDIWQLSEEELDTVRRQIGYVFQNNALFESDISEDVYSNISLPLRKTPYDYPAANEVEIEMRVAKVMEAVGLGKEYFDRLPDDLSGGQRKRVAVARAIIAEPPILIYDEPTTGLDPEYTEIIIDLIDKLYQSDRNTTIAVTHETKLMRRLNRVVFLKDTHVYFDGRHEDFFKSDDPVIVRFLAEGSEPRPQPMGPKALKLSA